MSDSKTPIFTSHSGPFPIANFNQLYIAFTTHGTRRSTPSTTMLHTNESAETCGVETMLPCRRYTILKHRNKLNFHYVECERGSGGGVWWGGDWNGGRVYIALRTSASVTRPEWDGILEISLDPEPVCEDWLSSHFVVRRELFFKNKFIIQPIVPRS